MFVFENVPNILSAKNGEYLQNFQGCKKCGAWSKPSKQQI